MGTQVARFAVGSRMRRLVGPTVLLGVGFMVVGVPVGVPVGVASAGAAASRLGRPIPSHVVTSPIVRHGPFVLTAAELARFRPGRVVAGDDYSVPRGSTCLTFARCVSVASAEVTSASAERSRFW